MFACNDDSEEFSLKEYSARFSGKWELDKIHLEDNSGFYEYSSDCNFNDIPTQYWYSVQDFDLNFKTPDIVEITLPCEEATFQTLWVVSNNSQGKAIQLILGTTALPMYVVKITNKELVVRIEDYPYHPVYYFNKIQ